MIYMFIYFHSPTTGNRASPELLPWLTRLQILLIPDRWRMQGVKAKQKGSLVPTLQDGTGFLPGL